MAAQSPYKTVISRATPRKTDYEKIYKLRDAGIKIIAICAELNIKQGTYYHAMNLRKKL